MSKISCLDLKGGIIKLLSDIDFTIPIEVQKDLLVQDICQIKYSNDHIIDVGWYPEDQSIYDDSCFKVYLVKGCDWENPINIINVKSLVLLKEVLINQIEKMITLNND